MKMNKSSQGDMIGSNRGRVVMLANVTCVLVATCIYLTQLYVVTHRETGRLASLTHSFVEPSTTPLPPMCYLADVLSNVHQRWSAAPI